MTPFSAHVRAQIVDVVRRADACATARDVDGYLALTTADVVMDGAKGIASGQGAVGTAIAAIWSSEPAGTRHVTSDVSVYTVDPETARTHSTMTLLPAGSHDPLSQVSVTQLLRKSGDRWLIAHRTIQAPSSDSPAKGISMAVTPLTPPTTETDVSYGGTDDESLTLDIYRRDVDETADAARAAIVLIHGGGWFRGDKSKETSLATRLVEAGYIVFVPNYRLAPAHPFPAGREDVLAAAAWAAESAYSFDRARFAFFGGSAGGNLSVEAGIATGRPAVSWSGIFDLEHFVEQTDATVAAQPTQQDLDAMRSADINQTGPDDAFLRWVILEEVGGDRAQLAAASTTQHASAKAGPVYFANSIDEFVPVADPAAMQRALAGVGVASTLQLIPGHAHAEGYTEAAIDGTLTFLQTVLANAR